MSEWIGHNFADLALFASVIDQGGFTAAARKTGIPQSTISRRIAALEARIGIRLLDRSTRHMRLSEAGQRTYDHARQMIEAGDAALRSGDMLKAEPSGLLRVAAPVMLSRSHLPDAVRHYMRAHALVSVSLEFTTRNLDPVDDDVDVVIQAGVPARSPAHIDKLLDTHLGVFLPPSFKQDTSQTPAGLEGSEIFAATRGSVQQTLVFRRGEETIEAAVSLRLRCNDIGAVIEAAENCGGYALIPEFAKPPGWKQIWTDWTLPGIEIVALTTRHGRLLPRISAFIDCLKAEM